MFHERPPVVLLGVLDWLGGMGQVYRAADITWGLMMVVSVPTDPALTLGTPQCSSRHGRLTKCPEPMTERWSTKES